MLRIALKWGGMLGIAICVWTLCVHALGWYTTDLAKGQPADQVAIILPVSALFLVIRDYSRYQARTASLLEAVGVPALSGLVSVPISAGFLWLYHPYINPAWLDPLVSYERQKLANSAVSEAKLNETSARLVSSGTGRSQLLGALVGTLIISIWNLRHRLGDHAILWEPSGQGDPNVASLRKHRGLICAEVSGSHRSSFSVQEQAELEPDTYYKEIKC